MIHYYFSCICLQQTGVVEDKQELEARGHYEPVKAIDEEEVADRVDEEQVIQCMDHEASAVEDTYEVPEEAVEDGDQVKIMDDCQVADEEPISENKEEHLTSSSDDQDHATMLPHDQQ